MKNTPLPNSKPGKRRTSAWLLLCLLSIATTNAQHRLSGTVTDSIGRPIDAAVFTLMTHPSGSPSGQGITDSNGKFAVDAAGDLQLYISCLGYKHYVSPPFAVKRDTVFAPICLQAESFLLDDVVVIGEKQTPSIRIERGKMIFLPRNSNLVAGSTALEALKKTPGVFVDGENNISIGGKNSVLVMLNGKQTYMQQEELTALLRSMPAVSVEAVEVIHNPSAQYDAEGSGGIINIQTDKKRADGFFLSVNNGLSYWNNLRENTELSFSYTTNRLSLSGSYNHTFGYLDMDYGMHRIQGGKEYHSPTDDTDKRKTVSGSLNVEYRLNEKQLLGGGMQINTLFGPGQTSTVTEIRDAESGTLEQTLYGSNDYYKQKGNRYGGNLYYTLTPREGVCYTADFNYAWFDGGSGNRQPNVYKSPTGETLQDNLYRSVNGRNIHIYALALNQQHPLWSGELKTGVKYASVHADNDYRFYNVVGEREELDGSLSNHFIYKEQIAAAYLTYNRNLGAKVNLEVGLRGEYTSSDGSLHTTDHAANEQNRKNYFNLFPSFSLNYRMNEQHALTLSYGSRIDRPAYQDLNPFEYLLDELSYWKGNPFLMPQKTQRISLTYSHKRTALTAAYTYMKDYKTQITDTLATNKVVMTPRNIGKQQRASLTLYQGLNLFRWWESGLNLTGYYVKNDIAFDRYRAFHLDGFAGIFSMQNTLQLPGEVQMELNASYVTRRIGASNETVRSSGSVDIGFSKSFARKRWTVNLAISDLFWTNRWDNYSSFSGFRLWNWGKVESRQVKLNITYRFGKQKSQGHASDFDEIKRL